MVTLHKFTTGIFHYTIKYADYIPRPKTKIVDGIVWGRYDGAVWFERTMGPGELLDWSLESDKDLIEHIKEKFNLVQVTWNHHHNGFSADYVTRAEGRKIGKYLMNYIKRDYYKDKENFRTRKRT